MILILAAVLFTVIVIGGMIWGLAELILRRYWGQKTKFLNSIVDYKEEDSE